MNRAVMWRVAVPTPLRRLFTYEVPESLGEAVAGARVLVPFGHRRITGYLVEPATEEPSGEFRIKPAQALLDDGPVFPEELFRLLVEAASYYMHPVGEVLRTALPPGIDVKERQGELLNPRIKRKTYRMVRPAPGAAEAVPELSAKAPKRAEVLGWVVEAGETWLADLRSKYKGATGVIKRLEEDGLVVVEALERLADPFVGPPVARDVSPDLNPEQAVAVEAIVQRLDWGGYEGFLLHGVTGSGKTEVYLNAIAKAHALGKGALVLVPEISLTPQLVYRYRARFGDALAVLHSGLTDRERFDQWQRLRSGQVRVAIGVRSAIFAPIQDLGIIVVDEEHDSSFKQERGFHYNARDLALLRAARAGAVAVLGSATPSIDTSRNAQIGKLTRLSLTTRATDQPLPLVEIVDLTKHRSGPGGQNLIMMPLYEALKETVARGEQAILFLNRRGFAPALLCSGCGELLRCDSCAVSLTYHRRPVGLVCHYCGARRPIPERCAKCGCEELKPVGSGTQKAEDILEELFPDAKVGRLDRDVATGRKVEAILDRLRRREIDILVGTQMVTKGHDFPHVTLVGVLNADVGLHMPDFRAAEKTFQLLTQVSGRAGRSALGGRALIQTYSPGHPAIATAQKHDYHTFARMEIDLREELGYPPFGRLAALRLSSLEEAKVEVAARELFVALKNQRDRQGVDVVMLGPVPAPLSFVQNRYRWRILLRSPRQDLIRRLLDPLVPQIEAPPSGVRINLDIDPVSML